MAEERSLFKGHFQYNSIYGLYSVPSNHAHAGTSGIHITSLFINTGIKLLGSIRLCHFCLCKPMFSALAHSMHNTYL